MQPLSNFNRRAKSADGLTARCRDCLASYQRILREEHPDRISKYREDYQNKNPEKIKESNRKYHENNREKRAEYAAEYRAKNPEKIKAQRVAYLSDPNVRSHANERSRRWSEENPERVAEGVRDWKRRNPEKVREAAARREARKASLTTEEVDYSFLYMRDKACYLCLRKFENCDDKHVDHVTPLARTELKPTHSLGNCAVTHAQCNLRKRTRTPSEYWEMLYTQGEFDNYIYGKRGTDEQGN